MLSELTTQEPFMQLSVAIVIDLVYDPLLKPSSSILALFALALMCDCDLKLIMEDVLLSQLAHVSIPDVANLVSTGHCYLPGLLWVCYLPGLLWFCHQTEAAVQGNEAILRSASTMRHGAGREKKIPAMYQQQ